MEHEENPQEGPVDQDSVKLLTEKIQKLEIDLENFPVNKVFIDVFAEDRAPRPARVIMLDPRILEIDNLDLFFDVFKKNVKDVRENYKFEPMNEDST